MNSKLTLHEHYSTQGWASKIPSVNTACPNNLYQLQQNTRHVGPDRQNPPKQCCLLQRVQKEIAAASRIMYCRKQELRQCTWSFSASGEIPEASAKWRLLSGKNEWNALFVIAKATKSFYADRWSINRNSKKQVLCSACSQIKRKTFLFRQEIAVFRNTYTGKGNSRE